MKTIHKIDTAMILVSVFALIFLVGYMRPLVIAPLDNYSTSNTEVLFSIDNADKVLIDDNADFTTPDEYLVEDGMKINLVPGEYYWKAVGVVDGDIRTLNILSEVSLELKKIDNEHYGIVNSGNVRLNVDVYNGTELIDQKKLLVGEEDEMQGSKFVGGYDE
jgi:hypothetical protein